MVSYRFLFLTTLSALRKGASGSFLADTSLFFLSLDLALCSVFVLTTPVVVVAFGLTTFLVGLSVPVAFPSS